MKKRVVACLLAVALIASGCSSASNTGADKSETDASVSADNSAGAGDSAGNTEKEGQALSITGAEPLLGNEEIKYYDENLVPSIPAYDVNDDFSNVVLNSRQVYIGSDSPNAVSIRKMISKNNFAVTKDGSSEFFECYEGNRYSLTPSFVTVDSLMHTYHLYFSYLMKDTEKKYLADKLGELSKAMCAASEEQYNSLKGTDYESAALTNLEFFYIGCKLLDDSVAVPASVNGSDFDNAVQNEIDKIMAANSLEQNVVTGIDEDYSQYKPRGYYDGDEQLEKYFRAMMWYGRAAFSFNNEDSIKSAVLQTLATEANKDLWNSIYSVTSFFAGASDDPGYNEMIQLVNDSYGSIPAAADISSNKDAFDKLCGSLKNLKAPEINSVPVAAGEDPVVPSYRFMGQRFTIDEAIMQRLVYSSVKENSKGEQRTLPDTLDTAAALGSEKAMEILTEQGATDYQNYTENMATAKEHFNNSDSTIWNASLYSGWLNTLRPLLEKKGEGYPSYMQNDEWAKKNLETFAGSYAELKHDTILYTKQMMAEMGDGDEDVPDDRGYVDPQPVVYSRFKFLSEKTKEGLDKLGMLDDANKENLDKLSEIAGTLLTISEKELKNEGLTDDEYEYIRCYGGYIEHFWKEATQDMPDVQAASEAPCPIVADIATDPNGTVLEVGTGWAECVYVVFPIDGELHLGTGSVYSFYQFEQPASDRLTDIQWREALRGGHFDDEWNWVENTQTYEQPAWTQSYKVEQE